MELPQQRQRVVVDGLGKVGEIKENKTVESGISGKKHLSTLSNKVNLEYISSKEYHNKFKGITDNSLLNEQLYSQAKAILVHRNGTDKEDLILINHKTGEIEGMQSSSKSDFIVDYNKSLNSAIINNEPYTLVSLHNHSTNNPPTGSDFVSCGWHKYKMGVVVTHNGKVFTYKTGVRPFSSNTFGRTVDKYRNVGYNLSEYEAIIQTLKDYEERYGISWKEIL